jgi:hypothetical protein
MKATTTRPRQLVLRAALAAASCCGVLTAVAATPTAEKSAPPPEATAMRQAPATTVALLTPSQSAADWRSRQGLYYKRNWGVEIIGVKPVSSGLMLAFKYRVIDPEKAKLLNNRQTRAFLRDEATGNVLSVPAMENVGELRTGAAPEAGRTYFMIFGNPGPLVKSGSKVSIVVGSLHVDGLIVD